MARTDAKIVDTSQGKAVMVETHDGFAVWPILYRNDTVAYDYPERVPKFIRPKVYRLLKQLQREGHSPWNS